VQYLWEEEVPSILSSVLPKKEEHHATPSEAKKPVYIIICPPYFKYQ
jgi:hypothetical protein